MRDDLAAPNIGQATKNYDQSFFYRSYRDIEMFITRFLSKGPITVSDVTADSLTVNGVAVTGGAADFDTTLVAATGSTLGRTMPQWLAGAPIFEIIDDVLLAPEHLGAWLHMMNDVGSLVILPDDWLPGHACGVRWQGLGQVLWQIQGGSTMQLPLTKSAHIGISEQYEEIILRVISNSDGSSAVWGVSGSTF